MAQMAQTDESPDTLDLPQEVLDSLPDDIREEIISGARDQIPENIVEELPVDVADQIPDSLVGAATSNPGLTAVVVIIGVLALAGAVWGAIKGFLKVAIGLGLIAAVAWYFFFVR